MITLELLKQVKLRHRFHPFSDNLHLELAAQSEDCFDHRLCLLILLDLIDETTVNLDPVEGEATEIA